MAYLEKLAALSDRAKIDIYGYSHEKRPLVILTISSPENMQRLDEIQKQHLEIVDTKQNVSDFSICQYL